MEPLIYTVTQSSDGDNGEWSDGRKAMVLATYDIGVSELRRSLPVVASQPPVSFLLGRRSLPLVFYSGVAVLLLVFYSGVAVSR